MGAWGITVRQSDDGLDLLDTIVAEQLRKVNFATFNVSEAVTLLKQNIQEEIEQYKQKPPVFVNEKVEQKGSKKLSTISTKEYKDTGQPEFFRRAQMHKIWSPFSAM